MLFLTRWIYTIYTYTWQFYLNKLMSLRWSWNSNIWLLYKNGENTDLGFVREHNLWSCWPVYTKLNSTGTHQYTHQYYANYFAHLKPDLLDFIVYLQIVNLPRKWTPSVLPVQQMEREKIKRWLKISVTFPCFCTHSFPKFSSVVAGLVFAVTCCW